MWILKRGELWTQKDKQIKCKIGSSREKTWLVKIVGKKELVKISGINRNVKQEELEEKVIEICNATKVEIDGHRVSKYDITACHRIGRKGKTICRFVNRKFANGLLYNSKSLKDVAQLKSIYVNNSFCREYGLINFLIRRAHKHKQIYRY